MIEILLTLFICTVVFLIAMMSNCRKNHNFCKETLDSLKDVIKEKNKEINDLSNKIVEQKHEMQSIIALLKDELKVMTEINEGYKDESGL